jgi:hypothetical protein
VQFSPSSNKEFEAMHEIVKVKQEEELLWHGWQHPTCYATEILEGK